MRFSGPELAVLAPAAERKRSADNKQVWMTMSRYFA
jgi:hypothetical protein